MFRRARPTFSLAAALLALAMQWCVPLAHASHVAHAEHDHAHHHGHDHEGESRDGHDESRCPTCQQFARLRTVVLPVVFVAIEFVDVVDVADAPACGGPLNAQVHRPPAIPRAPPSASTSSPTVSH